MKILQEPFEITLAGNPVIYRVESNNLYSNDAVFPSVTLVFDDKAEQGDGFRFQIKDPDSGKPVFFRFTAAATLDPDGWIYLNNTHVGSLSDYTEAIYNQLLKNEILAYYFTLSFSGTALTFTANYPTADLVPMEFEKIQFNLLGIPSDHFDFTISNLFLEKTRRTNFRMIADVFFEDEKETNKWRKVATLTESPDENGVSVYDISSILKHELEASYPNAPVPDFGSTEVYKNNLGKRYYIAFCETYENQAVDNYWNNLDPKLVHWGGVSVEDWAKGNPFTYFAATEKFLTWWPNNKILKANQNDWLTWINFTNDEIDVFVQFRIYYTDGTNSGWQVFGDTLTLSKWEEITTPVGYFQLSVPDIDPTKTAYKWQVSVKKDGGGIVSEIRTFRFNDRTNLHDRELIYLNGFGAPESFITIGVWEEIEEIEKQNSERQLPFNYKILNGQLFQFNQTSKTNYSARTGYFENEAMEALKTVLQETSVFLNDGEWIPVVIFADSFSVKKDLRFLHSLQFELARSYRSQRHSKIQRKPIFEPIVGCSLTGFKVDTNGQEVETFNAMELSKDGVVLEPSVAFNLGTSSYTFPSQDKEGVYRVKAEFNMADGTDISYDFNYTLRHEKAFIDVPDRGAVEIIMQTKTGYFDTKVFVDWDLTTGIEEFLVSTSPTSLTETIYHEGRKRVKLSTLCPHKIDYIYLNENTKGFNLNTFKNITRLKLAFCQTDGKIDLSVFQELENIEITDTAIKAIEFGFHKNISNINLESNELSADEIELVLLAIWKWRNYYTADPITVSFAGNPGAGGSMTSTAIEIINGTGGYAGEGLTTDYSFIITY